MAKNKAVPAVFLIFASKGGRRPFLRRYNTGHMDGMLGLPAGKIDENELPKAAVAREAFEEVGVVVKPQDLELVHIQYHSQSPEIGGDYLNFYFLAHKWEGELRNAEPESCSEIVYLDSSDMALVGVIPYVADVLRAYRPGDLSYSEYVTRVVPKE